MSKDILTGWLENSNGGYFTPKTFDTLVFMKAASDAQGKLVDLPTYFQEAIFDREIKIDLSHNNTCAFGSMEDGSWPGVTGILGTANGGTGNADGYIRTGAYPGSYIGRYATAEGQNTFAWGQSSHIEGGGGYGNAILGHEGLPEGLTKDSSNEDIIAGWRDFGFINDAGGFSLAKGTYSHVEGDGNLALGSASHAQGGDNIALGDYSTVGGYVNEANGDYSFAFGSYSRANGKRSFAFGYRAHANGENAFAIGEDNTANGKNSFAMGYDNIAHGENSFIIGKYAKTATDDNLAFAVGNGNGIGSRSNAFAIDWDGNAFVKTRLSAADITVTNGISASDIEVDNDLTIGNNITIGGTATIAKQLTVSSEGANITGDTSIDGGLTVSGLLTANALNVDTDLQVDGTANITGLLTAVSGINAQAASTFDDVVSIAGDLTAQSFVTIDQGLTVSGDANIGGTISNAIWDGQIINTAHGGTGNANGYIQTGALADSAIATRATIEGYQNIGSGQYSHVGGYRSQALGQSSLAHGDSVIAAGSPSIALGTNVIADGAWSIALGYNNRSDIYISGSGTSYTLYNKRKVPIIKTCQGRFDSSSARVDTTQTNYQTFIYQLNPGQTFIEYNALDSKMYLYSAYSSATMTFAGLVTTTSATSINLPSGYFMVASTRSGGNITVYQAAAFTPTIGSYILLSNRLKSSKITAAGTPCTVNSILSNTNLSYELGKYMQPNTTASYATAIGYANQATAQYALALGYNTQASGLRSMSANLATIASGENATSLGNYTIAAGKDSLVIGKYNVEDSEDAYAFIIGGGSSSNRSNIFTVDWDGSLSLEGNITFGDNGYIYNDTNALTINKASTTIAMNGVDTTITAGNLNLNCGALTLSPLNYGYQLPETGVEGQVFFLLLED